MSEAKIAIAGLRRPDAGAPGPNGEPGELVGAAIGGGPPKAPEIGGLLTGGVFGSYP
jgi:hypothetical protein